MTGAVQFDIDDSRVLAVLARLGAPEAEAKRAELDAAESVAQNIRTTFRDETDPFGHPWAPLKKATLRRREKRENFSTQILIDTTAMYASLEVLQAEAGAVVSIGNGLPDPRAPANQFGNGRAVARPFFPIHEDGQAELPGAWATDALLPIERAVKQLLGEAA
jgi:hypothetical protein